MISHHTVAIVSVIGSSLDCLGSLYLAYDLLGGAHGPLRLLTRAVTYSIVFGLGYGVGLGLAFGLACGITTGVTIAIELHRESRKQKHFALRWEALFSAIRGLGFAIAFYPILGLRFALDFAVLMTLGQISAYQRGMRPSLARTHGAAGRLIWGSTQRAAGYTITALICSVVATKPFADVWPLAIRAGLVGGIVTTIGLFLTPIIEESAERMPERRMGVFGVALLLVGFALQSLQYWLSLFDVRIT